MENEKTITERYQKILLVFSAVFLAIAVVLLVLRIIDVFDFGISLTIGCAFISHIFRDVSMWKTKPKLYTWMIALDSFMIGLMIMDIIDRLLG